MDSLREAVTLAAPRTGEVRRAIRESTFQPRAAAFTSLIQQCARTKAWEKALEVFEAMKETPGVKARCLHPISACMPLIDWPQGSILLTALFGSCVLPVQPMLVSLA